MEPSCVRHTEIPGTTALLNDYLYEFDRVRAFYPYYFADAEAFAQAAAQIDFSESRRGRLVSALRKQNTDAASLAKLAQQGTVVVATGQQVGLFSGPVFTIYKALTAVKLAEHLSEQGIPAVPIFWVATEDHDLAEVDHAWVFDQEARFRKIAATPKQVNGGPAGEVKLGELPFGELREALGELPFASEVVERVEAAYRPGATFGSAFREFLATVLKDCGLLYLDPLAPEIREIAAEFLGEAVERVPDLLAALRQRGRDLVAAGYHAQVHLEENSSLLFLLGEGKRTALRWEDGRFSANGRSYSAAELRERAGKLSPNALLRPVMQDCLLPTVSYVGGPSEIAYMAQAQVLYQRLLGRMPVLFPRNGFTLLDARAAKLLQRYELHVLQVFDYQENVKSRIAGRLLPRALNEEFASLRGDVSSALERARAELLEFDPTLASAAEKSSAKILYQFDKLSRKAGRETMRRDGQASKDAQYLVDLIYPQRRLQERFYSIVPFLAKYGLDLPQRLLEQTQVVCPDHMIRTF